MSNNTRNIWLFSLFVIFYCSYWYWRLSDFYEPPFYSEESPVEVIKIDVISNVGYNTHTNAEALSYILKFQDINRMDEDGKIEWEENIKNLVAMGYRAIPTIFEQLNTPIDINYKKILLQVLENIGDPLVQKDLEDLLLTYDSDAQIEVINTLLELKCTGSIPVLNELLRKTNDDEELKSNLEYALRDLKNILIEKGDYTEILKLFPIQIIKDRQD